MATYSEDSIVPIAPFTRQRDGGEVVIGLPAKGAFVALPEEAVDLLDLLAKGETVGQVSDRYYEQHGQRPDLEGLLQHLAEYGFIQDVPLQSESSIISAPESQAPHRYHFESFPIPLARALFSPPVLMATAALFCAAVLAMSLNRAIIPWPHYLYFPIHRTLSAVIVTFCGYLALIIHEFSHLIAARAVGVSSRFSIGHRLWYLVAETDLTGLWTLPRQRRYLPFLAGSIADILFGSVLVITIYISVRMQWLSPYAFQIFEAILFTYVMRVVWQCFLFVRTDFYYVIATYLGCRNLLGDTEKYLRGFFSPVGSPRRAKVLEIPIQELRIVRYYSVVWLGGRLAALALLCFVTLPVAMRYLYSTFTLFKDGFRGNSLRYIDSVVFLILVLGPLAAGIALWLKGLAERQGATV